MTTTHCKLKPLPAALLAVLCGASSLADAQNTAAEPAAVVVTGSRIPRASLEGPSAVTVISAEDITRQGYKNVFDALSNQVQNSGFVQGADFGNTFTPSANALSLRGLGPNHTLVLLNGRRLADFPIAYEGAVNFTNLANIPSSVVERIEILNGGASAIYGSDAIAGVINVVLKKRAQGYDINLKAGSTERGGGGDKRAQFSGGSSGEKLNTIFSLELSERDPLWSKQRDFMASKAGTPATVLARKEVKTGNFYSLGDACKNLADLFDGSTVNYTVKKGSYCASPEVGPTYWTTQTRNVSKNAFGSATYALSDATTLFGDVLLGRNDSANNTRGPSWIANATGASYFANKNTGVYEAWNKYISPEEMGGASRYNRHWEDKALAATVGLKGRLPGTQWDYEAAYNASLYQSENRVPRALANIDSFFLGPKLGVDANGVAIYAPDPARLTKRLTPAEFDGITGNSHSDDESWTNTLSFTTNGDLLHLPAGALKIATVAEAGRQGYTNTPDAGINAGVFNTIARSDPNGGTRTRYALGAEASIPLLKQVTSTLAARYDRYSFANRNEGKFTYNAGLEVRPAKELLARGNYATSFRAPDMNYIYKSRGTGYYSSTTDYFRCAQAGQKVESCEYANVSPGSDYVQLGSKDLNSEKGKSWGVGLVWSPSASFDASADYWNVKIDDLVTNLSAGKLLRDEALCRLGGADINSPSCVDTLSRIKRNPLTALNKPGEIKEITVNPINAAHQGTSGIDLTARYALRGTGFGDFVLRGSYAKTLTKRYKQFNGDEIQDELHSLDNTDWPDKLNASLAWSIADWTNTVSVNRYGKLPNGAQDAYLTPTALVNFSTVYRLNKRTTVSVIVNNVFDKIKHDTTGGWPNYPVGNYSPAGRAGWVELNYHL